MKIYIYKRLVCVYYSYTFLFIFALFSVRSHLLKPGTLFAWSQLNPSIFIYKTSGEIGSAAPFYRSQFKTKRNCIIFLFLYASLNNFEISSQQTNGWLHNTRSAAIDGTLLHLRRGVESLSSPFVSKNSRLIKREGRRKTKRAVCNKGQRGIGQRH